MAGFRLFYKVAYYRVQEKINWILEQGFSGVDLSLVDTNWLMRGDYDLWAVETLGKWLKGQGLEITVHGPFQDLQIGSRDEFIRDYSRKCYFQAFELAQHLGAKRILFHSNFAPGMPRDRILEKWFQHCIRTWEELAREAEKVKVNVVVENVYDPHEGIIQRILEEVNSPYFGVCLDIGHAWTYGADSPLDRWLDAFGQRIQMIHIHDSNGQQDHLPLGTGQLPLQETLRKILQMFPELDAVVEMNRDAEVVEGIQFLQSLPLA